MDMLREAGWPIYPVLLLGTCSLLTAIRYARDPRRDLMPLVVGLGLATTLMGLLGTVLGLDVTVRGLVDLPPEERWIFLIGLKESLHNLSVALAFTLATALTTTVGSRRPRG